jgi:hypothetical protein
MIWSTNAYFTHTLCTLHVVACLPVINGTHAQGYMTMQHLLHTLYYRDDGGGCGRGASPSVYLQSMVHMRKGDMVD